MLRVEERREIRHTERNREGEGSIETLSNDERERERSQGNDGVRSQRGKTIMKVERRVSDEEGGDGEQRQRRRGVANMERKR